jgi:hypothetical protein
MLFPFVVLSLAAAVVSMDSVSNEHAGEGIILPAFTIAHEELEECSGIVWHGGAFYAHNDSEGDPVLFRSRHLSFPEDDTEVLRVPNAEAIDWEDITVLDGDLIVGDIGDNLRLRSHSTLYRVRYVAATDAPGRLELIAVYPFQYPDGPHDAEALAVIDGKVHLVTKAREEAVTHVYIFDNLRDGASLPRGEMNVPQFAACLEIGEGGQVTAADYDPETETLVLMTYTHLLQYPKQRIEGRPARSTLIAARQNEAICFRGSQVVFTNEQRDVFMVDRFFSRRFHALLPERGRAILPAGTGPFRVDGRGRSWREQGNPIPLANAREGEEIRWCLVDDHLLVHGRLHYENEFRFTDSRVTELAHLGSGAVLVFAHNPNLELGGEELQIAVGLSKEHQPSVWHLDLTLDPMGMKLLREVEIDAEARDGIFLFEMALPLFASLADHIRDPFLFDVHGLELHGPDEVHFSGIDIYTVFRPYLWGEVTLRKPPSPNP